MTTAVALLLRGSLVAPALVAVEVRKWQRYGHAGILLADGRLVEASARHNRVIDTVHPCEWYNYERACSLSHLGKEIQERIGTLALSMVGWEYDWRAAKSQTLEDIIPYNEEDSRRVICFELAALATKEFFNYDKPLHLVDGRDLERAWKDSFKGVVK